MYINRGSVNLFLNNVHQQMQTKYGKLQQIDVNNANELQMFFQNLKTSSMQQYQSGYPITDNEINIVLEMLYTTHPKMKKLGIFNSKGGASLEYELANVIEVIYNLTTDITNNDSKFYRVGQNVGTVLQSVVTNGIQDMLNLYDKKFKAFLKEDAQRAMKRSGIPRVASLVQGKVDVQGGFYSINFTPTTYLEKIMILLNNATFSAKNYSSINSKAEALNEIYPTLKIGKSNPYRAYAGALESLKYNYITIVSSFISANKEREKTAQHIYHLRFIYELAGTGITNSNGNYEKEVKYLVYNDPTGSNIYVESVAKIISEILNLQTPIEDPFKGITIKKQYFKNQEI